MTYGLLNGGRFRFTHFHSDGVLANEVLQGIYGEIIYEEILQGNGRGESSIEFAKNTDQKTQEDLLYHRGIIDEGVKGEMANVRKTRNKVVHDIRKRQYLKGIPDIENMIDRAYEVLNTLHIEAHGDSPFEVDNS